MHERLAKAHKGGKAKRKRFEGFTLVFVLQELAGHAQLSALALADIGMSYATTRAPC